MTNSSATVIVSSKYLQINEIHDIRERFIIPLVFPIFVVIQLKESANDWNWESKFHRQGIRNWVPGIRNPQLEKQKPRLPWITLKCLKIAFLKSLNKAFNFLTSL